MAILTQLKLHHPKIKRILVIPYLSNSDTLKDTFKNYNNNGQLDSLLAYVDATKTNPYVEYGWYGTWSCWRIPSCLHSIP